MGKIRGVVFTVVVVILLSMKADYAHAVPPAYIDWSWSFTEARDRDSGIVLGKISTTSPTTQKLVFTTSPTNGIVLYGTLFPNQVLTLDNTDLVGAGCSLDGVDFFSNYDASFNRIYDNSLPTTPYPLFSDYFDNMMPMTPGTGYGFWFYAVYPYSDGSGDPISVALGTYGVHNGDMNVRNVIAGGSGYTSVRATNAVEWTVTETAVPEPATMFLLSLGLAGIRFFRRV